jgi:integrase
LIDSAEKRSVETARFRIGRRESEISRRGPVRIARKQRLDYDGFLYVCQQARRKLGLRKPKKERRLPQLLSEGDLKRFLQLMCYKWKLGQRAQPPQCREASCSSQEHRWRRF